MRRFTASAILPLAVCSVGLLSTHGRAQLCRYFELQKLWAWNFTEGDTFGTSVAMDGDWLVVGAQATEMLPMFSNTGSAYVFRRHDHNTPGDRTDDTWMNNTELVPWDAQGGEQLGISVSISGDRIIAGAYSEGCRSDGCFSGAAYVFRYNGTAWVPEQKLLASDRGENLRFGMSVSISGGWLAVGSVWGSTFEHVPSTVGGLMATRSLTDYPTLRSWATPSLPAGLSR